jgi:hypothetical protein
LIELIAGLASRRRRLTRSMSQNDTSINSPIPRLPDFDDLCL